MICPICGQEIRPRKPGEQPQIHCTNGEKSGEVCEFILPGIYGKYDYLKSQSWKIVDWGQFADYKRKWYWDGIDRHYVHDLETSYMIAKNNQYNREFDEWQANQVPRQLALF